MTELTAEATRRAIVEHTRRLAESAAAAGPDAAVAHHRSLLLALTRRLPLADASN